MAIEIEEAFSRFGKLYDELEAEAKKPVNEASTRFHILDRYLKEVLGWSRAAISVEGSTDSGFYDYCLSLPDGRPALIIEAKRAGSLDIGITSQSVSPLLLSGPVLKPVLPVSEQAARYASYKSVPLACITDGKVWVVFQTNRRDGKGVMDGRGWFFPSQAAVRTEFPKFYELLGPRAVAEHRGLQLLRRGEGILGTQPETQYRLLEPSDARLVPTSDLSSAATRLFDVFFSKLSSKSDREMRRECFVETPESIKTDEALKEITERILADVRVINTADAEELSRDVKRAVTALSTERILLIGNKGSGKSTFIERFFEDILPFSTRKDCAIIRVDFAEFDGEFEQMAAWATRRSLDLLEADLSSSDPPSFDDLRGLLWDEYNRLRMGSLAPLYNRDSAAFDERFGEIAESLRREEPLKYLKLLVSRCVKGQKKLPCFIFDNSDDLQASEQDAVFKLANSFGELDPVLTIVPVTDRSLWRLSNAGSLQSYKSKSFFLPVPEAKKIFMKRIAFVKRKLAQTQAGEYFSALGFNVKTDAVARLAQAVEKLFVSSDYVSGLIGRLTNFEIRRMLMLAEQVFISPQIKIDEVLISAVGTGALDMNRVQLALLRGQRDRFVEDEHDFVLNLFWSDASAPSSPMLSVFVLALLKHKASIASPGDTALQYITVSDMVALFESAGVDPGQVMIVLARLHDKRLIEALDVSVSILGMGERIAVRPSGIAHLEMAYTSLTYLSEMARITGLPSKSAVDHVRHAVEQNGFPSFAIVKALLFTLNMLDVQRVQLPSGQDFSVLRQARIAINAGQGPGEVAGDQPPTRKQEPAASLSKSFSPKKPKRFRR